MKLQHLSKKQLYFQCLSQALSFLDNTRLHLHFLFHLRLESNKMQFTFKGKHRAFLNLWRILFFIESAGKYVFPLKLKISSDSTMTCPFQIAVMSFFYAVSKQLVYNACSQCTLSLFPTSPFSPFVLLCCDQIFGLFLCTCFPTEKMKTSYQTLEGKRHAIVCLQGSFLWFQSLGYM